jgi:uncharacterized protein
MSDPGGEQLAREAIWRRLDEPGAEHFRLWTIPGGARLEGTVVVVEDEVPMRLTYRITTSDWHTHEVRLTFASGDDDRPLHLIVDREQRWAADGKYLPSVNGCLDVDLSLTPATNLLAVHTAGLLDLPLGEPRDVTSTYVLFPQMSIEPLAQRYTRIGDRRFHYLNLDGTFETEIEVDDMGLVVSYPPFWERVPLPTREEMPR